ncbi:MAG TPA: ferric reductase-like transmembrane domain-containing protein [Acidimicrobiales bacterium]
MLAYTSPYLWYTTRATGLVALVLFTIVVCLGTLVSNRVGGNRVGRFEFNELHRSLSLVAMAFLVVHIVTTIVDSYVPTGWVSAVVPWTSHYERLNVALGTVAFDLMLCVWVSSLMKTRIANSSWRFIHWLSWLAFVAAIVHSFLTGTDARSGIGLAIVTACAAAVFVTAIWRYVRRPTRASGRTALSPIPRVEDDATSDDAKARR